MEKNKEKNFVSVVVYVYNQANSIYKFLQTIYQILEKNFEHFEIICVNDSSTDQSVEEIKHFSQNIIGSTVSILNMSFHQGMELSMNAGVDLAIGDFVYEFDTTDINYPNNMIFDVYAHSIKGYDIVSAAPINTQRLSSKLFYIFYNRVSNTQFPLRTEAFRILSRRAINRVHSMSKTIPYRKAIYSNCGLKVDSLTYENHEKTGQQPDKIFWHNQVEVAVDTLVLYSDIAYRFSMFLSSAMVLLTVLIGLYTICIYLGGRPVAGWTTTMLFLTFLFCGLFAILTIIIKYISIILSLSFNRQKYVVESIDKLNH